jgi:hypothetical protein
MPSWASRTVKPAAPTAAGGAATAAASGAVDAEPEADAVHPRTASAARARAGFCRDSATASIACRAVVCLRSAEALDRAMWAAGVQARAMEAAAVQARVDPASRLGVFYRNVSLG